MTCACGSLAPARKHELLGICLGYIAHQVSLLALQDRCPCRGRCLLCCLGTCQPAPLHMRALAALPFAAHTLQCCAHCVRMVLACHACCSMTQVLWSILLCHSAPERARWQSMRCHSRRSAMAALRPDQTQRSVICRRSPLSAWGPASSCPTILTCKQGGCRPRQNDQASDLIFSPLWGVI